MDETPAVPASSWALISGGGTAGHVQPGLDIGRALIAGGRRVDELHFVGSERGIETRLVPEAGFSLTVLPGRGIQRRLTPENFGAVLGLLRAVGSSFGLVRRQRPSVIVSLGGYASVPCSLAGAVFRVPIVVAEQNAVPGLANRLVGRFARACAVSFPDVDLPKAVWTGNPVRETIRAVDRRADRATARATLGIDPDAFLVSIFGGSLGARRINNAVLAALPAWAGHADLVVRHIIGARDYDDIMTRVPESPPDGVDYRPIRYEDDMASVYAASDLFVCRAGATTVAELAVTGSPAIVVPLPGAPGDHQTANARGLVEAGAAVMVVDAELDADRLVTEVERLRAADSLGDMAAAAAELGRPDAAEAVADLVERHARRHRPGVSP